MKHHLLKPYSQSALFTLVLLLGATYWLDVSGLSQHFGWLALLFAFGASLCCWLFISCWQFGEVACKRVDYFWLPLVCAAVVEVAVQARGGSLSALQLQVAPVALVVALALRVARVKAEIRLKTPRDNTLWLVFDRQLVMPMPDPLLSRETLRTRLRHELKQWCTRRYSRAFVRLIYPAGGRIASTGDLLVPVSLGWKDCEFELDTRKGLAGTALAEWIAVQGVRTVYLYGVVDLQVLEAMVKWGEQAGVEIFLDNGNGQRFEQAWRVDLSDTANAPVAIERLRETVDAV
ncbi:hypothetical protein D3C76_755410 [compost metagenome]